MQRLLIVGCGDVARRALPMLTRRFRVYALVRKTDARSDAELRRLGVTRILGDLDRSRTLKRLAGLADMVLHFAPPPGEFGSPSVASPGTPDAAGPKPDRKSDAARETRDTRTQHLIAALSRTKKILPRRVVYISTSGVYGDCAGARVDETSRLAARSPRARRRIDAENRLRSWCRRGGAQAVILRVPGIYAGDRLPIERLRRGDPALRSEDDVYTNHIHADDLARISVIALRRGRPNRSYNVCDDSALKMADWFDAVAEAFALPRPERVSRAEAARVLSPAMLSFLAESRRLDNGRMKRELAIRLAYPTVAAGLAAARS